MRRKVKMSRDRAEKKIVENAVEQNHTAEVKENDAMVCDRLLKENFKRISAAVLYASTSFFIIVINKVILTTYRFPSFQVLGVGQMLTAIATLFIAKEISLVKFPDISVDVIKKVWPLPLFYLGNLVCGLGSTQKLNLPMFTVLRRFSILFTMILEYLILSVNPSKVVQLSVALMIFGALVASSTDLAFDAVGYLLVTINNLSTAGNGVYTKKKLETKELGKYGLVFYNCLFMLIPLALLAEYNGDFVKVYNFTGWSNPVFVAYFAASCFMGFLLNYSTILCTQYNSALTTTIVGVFKNLLVTYLGMVIGNDYIFSWPNFTGLNLSVFGSIIYTYVMFMSPPPAVQPKPPSTATTM